MLYMVTQKPRAAKRKYLCSCMMLFEAQTAQAAKALAVAANPECFSDDPRVLQDYLRVVAKPAHLGFTYIF